MRSEGSETYVGLPNNGGPAPGRGTSIYWTSKTRAYSQESQKTIENQDPSLKGSSPMLTTFESQYKDSSLKSIMSETLVMKEELCWTEHW